MPSTRATRNKEKEINGNAIANTIKKKTLREQNKDAGTKTTATTPKKKQKVNLTPKSLLFKNTVQKHTMKYRERQHAIDLDCAKSINDSTNKEEGDQAHSTKEKLVPPKCKDSNDTQISSFELSVQKKLVSNDKSKRGVNNVIYDSVEEDSSSDSKMHQEVDGKITKNIKPSQITPKRKDVRNLPPATRVIRTKGNVEWEVEQFIRTKIFPKLKFITNEANLNYSTERKSLCQTILKGVNCNVENEQNFWNEIKVTIHNLMKMC